MIRRFLARLIPGRPATEPRVFGPDAHPVRRSQLSRGAIDVTRKLQQAGFKAFIVGGAVRDLLLGITPKDFDIATNATPEEVKPLFRRAFIIGRRFRLVHVLAGPETVEVSTFRTEPPRHRDVPGHLVDIVVRRHVDRVVLMSAALASLRHETSLDGVGLVQTVVKRGYRLATDPVRGFG